MTEFKKVEELPPLNNTLKERTLALSGYISRLRQSVLIMETELEKRCSQLTKAEKELDILLNGEEVGPAVETTTVIDMVRQFFVSNPKEEVTGRSLLACLGLGISSSSTIRQSLKRLAEENFVVRVGHGVYRANKNLAVDSRPSTVPNGESK